MPKHIQRPPFQRRARMPADHPSKISLGAIREMKKRLARNPCITARKLKKDIPQLENVSVHSIQMFYKDQLSCPPARWQTSPERMKNDRLEFARRYEHWTVEDWKKVMFSDESHFELRTGHQGWRCRRSKGSDWFDPKFTRKRVKHPPKIMVWGCFCWRGRGGLEILKPGEMINGERYRKVLDEKLELFMA
jgi:hypothetical protein